VRFFGKRAEPEAPSLSDVEVVRTKLTAVEQAITSAEAELRRVSVEAALSDDPSAGSDIISRISELRTRHDLLSNALRAALQAERDNAGRLYEREFQTRRRSLAQKLGQLGRDAKEVTEALTALVRAHRKMIGTEGSSLSCPQSCKGLRQATRHRSCPDTCVISSWWSCGGWAMMGTGLLFWRNNPRD
jgi:hypothetical protein